MIPFSQLVRHESSEDVVVQLDLHRGKLIKTGLIDDYRESEPVRNESAPAPQVTLKRKNCLGEILIF